MSSPKLAWPGRMEDGRRVLRYVDALSEAVALEMARDAELARRERQQSDAKVAAALHEAERARAAAEQHAQLRENAERAAAAAVAAAEAASKAQVTAEAAAQARAEASIEAAAKARALAEARAHALEEESAIERRTSEAKLSRANAIAESLAAQVRLMSPDEP